MYVHIHIYVYYIYTYIYCIARRPSGGTRPSRARSERSTATKREKQGFHPFGANATAAMATACAGACLDVHAPLHLRAKLLALDLGAQPRHLRRVAALRFRIACVAPDCARCNASRGVAWHDMHPRNTTAQVATGAGAALGGMRSTIDLLVRAQAGTSLSGNRPKRK